MKRWKEVTAREFPDRPDLLELIPDIDEINIDKLGKGKATLITDTCNAARKLRRILVERIEGVVHEQDCMHHLRNVWINGVAKSVSAFMNDFLHDSLEDIASFLRVSPDLAHVIRAFHKEFSLTANYPKGHGEKFRDWMIEHYPMEYLMHAERAGGSRQDLVTMGAGPIYWNRVYNVEFLDETLRVKGNENILQQNLFIILSSIEMIAVARFFAIVHAAICMPFRWLAGTTHKLAHRNWGPRSMGRAIDILHSACSDIVANTRLIHDKSFMMNIFDELVSELPEFKEYMTREFETKTSNFVVKSQTKAVPNKMLLEELFTPSDHDNQDSAEMLEQIAAVGIQALIDELEDQSKATYKYLSMSGSQFSWEHCPDDVKKDMLGTMASNDLAESSFAGLTAQVQCYGRIGMCNAAAVSDTGRNGFFSRPTTKKRKRDGEKEEKKPGLFHGLPEELKITAGTVAVEDAGATRQSNSDALERQRAIRKQKDELAKQKGLENANDEYMDALIYHAMYDTPVCWKTAQEVTAGLKSLTTKKDKYEYLKNNIQIRYKGFGWEDWKTKWSNAGVQVSIPDLAKHLKKLIKTATRKDIPDKPEPTVPQRKSMPTMGTQTRQVQELDEKAMAAQDDIEKKAREQLKQDDIAGVSRLDKARQDKEAPAIDETLKGTKIEMVFLFDQLKADGTVDTTKPPLSRWCVGTVAEVCDGTWIKTDTLRARWKVGEAIEVKWEPIDEIGWAGGTSRVAINANKWNRDGDGGWRKHLAPMEYGNRA